MINKSGATRTKGYIDLALVSTAISQMNKSAASGEKHIILCQERDNPSDVMNFDLIVHVKYGNITIYSVHHTMPKLLDQYEMKRQVIIFCARVIVNFIQSGVVNYRLSVDSIAESFAQNAEHKDRISLIQMIIRFPPESNPGLSRGWSFYEKQEGDELGFGDWGVKVMLEATYEDLTNCLKELQTK